MAKMLGERPSAEYVHWDFSLVRDFEEDILLRLGSSVHFPCSSPAGSFFLLAVFRRSSFRLTEESVGTALHSVIGGSPEGFHIACVKPCQFRFSVASKAVGFLIRALKRVTTKNFDVYFHLWRDGGANWQWELSAWEEEEHRWTLVTKKKKGSKSKHVSFSSPIKLPSPVPKKSPVIGPQAIKLGSFSCLLQDQGKLPSSSSAIPVSRVFGSLKRQLGSNLKSVSNLDSHAQRVTANSQTFTAPPNMQSQPRPSNHNARAIEQRPRNLATGSPAATVEICPWRPPNRSRDVQGCFRCLALGHWVKHYTSRIRCRFCFRYGHIKKACFAKKREAAAHWRPKLAAKQSANQQASASLDTSPPRDVHIAENRSSSLASRGFSINQLETTATSSSSVHRCSTLPSPEVPCEVRSTTANYPVNPEPFLPPDFEIEHGVQTE
jgi:hypothetical protein